MEPKCFVNGCSDPVTLLWTNHAELTYSCKFHQIEDSNKIIKSQNFTPRIKNSSFIKKIFLSFGFITILILLVLFSKFLIYQNQFMNSVLKDIENLKSESSMNYRFYSEIVAVKDLLENHKMDFEGNKVKKALEKPKNLEIYNANKYSKKLSRREALVSLSNNDLNLNSKVELIVKHLGIVYEEFESEVLSIAVIENDEVMYGLMAGTISNVEISTHTHQIVVHGKSRVYKITPSKDLTTALVTGDTQVHIMSLTTKKYLKSFIGHSHWILTSTMSEDNKWYVTGSCDRSIKVWEHDIYKEKFQLQGHTADVWTVTVSNKNEFIVSGGEDKLIILWDFANKKIIRSFIGHTAPVYSVLISQKNEFLYSASGDGTIRLWNLDTGSQESVFEHKGMVRALVLINNDEILLSIAGKTLKIWDLLSMTLVSQMNHTGNLISLAVSKDEKLAFTGDVYSRLWVWDLENKVLKMVFGGAKKNVQAVEMSEDFQFVAIADMGIVRIWDIEKMKQIEVLVEKSQAEKWKNVLNVDNFVGFLG